MCIIQGKKKNKTIITRLTDDHHKFIMQPAYASEPLDSRSRQLEMLLPPAH
jgi:hypothetical protein